MNTCSSKQEPTRMSSTPGTPIGANLNNPSQQQSSTTTNTDGVDDGNNTGTSIDTFSLYRPTALPIEVVRSCNEWYNHENKTDTSVIDLTIDENTTTTTEDAVLLQVPSHTSSACESALLSSVAAPMVDIETSECILPLLSQFPSSQQQDQPQIKEEKEQESSTRFSIPPPPLSPLQLEGVLLSIQRHRRIHHHHQNGGTDGFRAGFFLGDGAGIGKGRQISAIIRDGLCRGRKRHVWISVSRELIKDAERDLKDVGVYCTDELYDGTNFLGDDNNKYSKGLGRKDKGILFLTYNLLVSSNRIDQISAWLSGAEHVKNNSAGKNNNNAVRTELEQKFDGCIIFDEAHKAKNLANNTKTAKLVVELQRRLPLARIVYCSATGVSDVDQLAYAERLGLWKIPKDNTNNINNKPIDDDTNNNHNDGKFVDFNAFRESLGKRGLGSLELLALELKTRGSLMARTLSWEGAEFQTVEVPLDEHQRQVYDRGVKWWTQCKNDLQDALKILNGGTNGQIWRTFWSAHQRFFKELAICAKVPFLVKDALEYINKKGCCVVFGLQGTGEAGMQSLLEGNNNRSSNNKKKAIHNRNLLQEDIKRFSKLMSTAEAGLTNFIRQHFPVTPSPPEALALPEKIPTNEDERRQYAIILANINRIQSLPPPAPHPALVAKRQVLLDAIHYMDLPPNPLDDLIDRLGGVDQVAEMTGRSGRIIRGGNNGGQFVYSKRIINRNNQTIAAVNRDDSERINIIERRKFMNGEKLVAIISDAASTGISLHAAHGSGASHKRRVHYTIELPWSADKAVQQLGRSHRSGQNSAPIYKLVVTNLGGERRFAAAVSKRLMSLGALTKGDRRAATGADMSEFDLDSKYGKRALKRFYSALDENEASGGETTAGALSSINTGEIVDEFIKASRTAGDPILKSLPNDDDITKHACVLSIATAELDRVGLDRDTRAKGDVRIFLNRLSGLIVTRQSLVFSLFMSTLNGVIKGAKSSGEFEGTAEDITATTIEIGEEVDLAVDPSSGAQTKLTTLVLDRGISFDFVCSLAIKETRKIFPDDDVVAEDQSSQKEGNSDDTRTNEKNEEGFIVLDEDDSSNDPIEDDDINDEDDEWMSSVKPKRSVAESGFYISKKVIAGRHLVLFAKRKFDRSNFKTEEDETAFDPLGLMQLTRPNTGTIMTDKTTQELRHTYRLAFSCEKLYELLSEPSMTDEAVKNPIHIIEGENAQLSRLWERAYKESDSYKSEKGLAPRRQKVSLVNGPVLHILPVLEKSVQYFSGKDKALKIMRAQVGSRRIVGMRFPSGRDAIEKLQSELDKINKARSNTGKSFTDEELTPICTKTMKWATTKRKTMKSFFEVASFSNTSISNNGKNLKNNIHNKIAKSALGEKRRALNLLSSGKKAKTMISYFGKKK